MHCLHCGSTTTNGLALCALCQRKVHVDLEFLPIYFRNLARWRPGRAGSRPVPGSRQPVTANGVIDPVGDALDEALNDLTTWARMLADDRPELASARPVEAIFGDLAATDFTEAQTVRLLCLGFERYLASIATLEWAGEFAKGIGEHEAKVRTLTERVAPGWYAGSCRREVGKDIDGGPLLCGAATYVVPGLTWVTCHTCGTTTYARDRLDVILEEAQDWVARPMWIAKAIVALVDTEPSVPKLYDRIRQRASRGDLKPYRHSQRGYVWNEALKRFEPADQEVGHARYRFGDVVDLVLPKTTRAKVTEKTSTAC